jgi:hypothetical protein
MDAWCGEQDDSFIVTPCIFTKASDSMKSAMNCIQETGYRALFAANWGVRATTECCHTTNALKIPASCVATDLIHHDEFINIHPTQNSSPRALIALTANSPETQWQALASVAEQRQSKAFVDGHCGRGVVLRESNCCF